MNEKLFKRLLGVTIIILLGIGGFRFLKSVIWNLENEPPRLKYNTFTSKETITPSWIEERKRIQLADTNKYSVFYDFTFENRVLESGITFQHLINPDGGIQHKPVHYDHGNGIAISDVDKDGDLDIYLVSLVGIDKLFINNGNGNFTEVTDPELTITGKKTTIGASFGDIDNDGDPDLYVSTIRDGNLLFENNGNGTFKDISEEAGVNFHGHSSGVVFFDYDLDGLLDIFVTNVGVYTSEKKEAFFINGKRYEYYVGLNDAFAGHLVPHRFEQSKLYKNLGDNRFESVGKQLGINDNGWTGDVNILDTNNDGYLDLYITNMQGNDLYYENQKGKYFIDKRADVFPNTPWGSMGVSTFDFDNNGKQDLYVTDMHSDMLMTDLLGEEHNKEQQKSKVFPPEEYLLTEGKSIFGNAFYRQVSTNKFEEISHKVGAENYWPWGISSGDLNADGFEDVFITASMNYPFRYATNSVLLNIEGCRFLNSEYILGIEPRKEFAKPWFTLDCSGDDKEHKHCNGKEGQVTIWGAKGSRSSVIFDIDNDGDLDIVTNEFNDKPQVLISNLSEQKPDLTYIKIKLEGTKSNRDGIGAKVVLAAGDNTYTKVLTGKSGYLSQSSFPLYFGLNGATQIDKIVISWPSGIQQEILSPDMINNLMIIKEKAS